MPASACPSSRALKYAVTRRRFRAESRTGADLLREPAPGFRQLSQHLDAIERPARSNAMGARPRGHAIDPFRERRVAASPEPPPGFGGIAVPGVHFETRR